MTELVIMILDGSSSMIAHKTATIEGFNKFLIEQQANEHPTNMSVLTFHGGNNWYSNFAEQSPTRILHFNKPVNEIPALSHESYTTSGNTNLLDAIGSVLDTEQPSDRVTICILTDGEENCSSKYSYESIKTLIQTREQQGWAFVFLGANIETFEVGSRLGINPAATLSYNTNNIDISLANASRVVNSLKGRDISNMQASYAASAFTESERKSSV
jgi:Mg-chelatase subunit ChlD